jgi:hypothetical protein
LYARTRIASRTKPNLQLSLELYGKDVMPFIGDESQEYWRDASKIWWSFLPFFFEDVLRCDEAVWHELPEPLGNMYAVVVLLFLVHGSHDLVDLGTNRGVIPVLPV